MEKQTSPRRIDGLHHVTAIASNPQQNLDFYAGVLGLRFIKQTINYDDPGTYHFYFGNEVGDPGTALTFFPISGAFRGSRGAGQATAISLSIPAGSILDWAERLRAAGGEVGDLETRFGVQAISFDDPDGLGLELVEDASDPRSPWTGGGIAADIAIRGIHAVTLTESDTNRTAALLSFLGFLPAATENTRTRYSVGGGGAGRIVDVVDGKGERGIVAAGTVHHIAFDTPDDRSQEEWRGALIGQHVAVSDILDRQYFHSIYFREPGGVLFEIATHGPGFTADESVEELGTSLRLPAWLEARRLEIAQSLPKIARPSPVSEAVPVATRG